jgi:general secretion pathway protein C
LVDDLGFERMDVLLKKYFWVISLGVIAICASLGGRTVAHFIEQAWLTPDDSAIPTLRRFTPPVAEKTHGKEVDTIVKRDVFCSSCAPITPTGDNPAGNQNDNAGGDQAPRRTDLPIELVSTMVVPSDENWSMAVIKDTSTKEKDSALYRRGSVLPGGAARVLRIIEKKVYLTNNNRIEYLSMDGDAPAQAAPVVAAPTAVASGDPLDNDINKGVRCNGSNCEIDRPLIDKLLANTTMLATAARFVPSIKDGKPNGFKLYAIRPNSIFGKIGLQNGDTVKSINGMEMSSPDQALGVYSKVRSASHLTVSVERRGETTTLDYTIR